MNSHFSVAVGRMECVRTGRGGMAANFSAGSREKQSVPLYGWKVVGKGTIEMLFSPIAECHTSFLMEELPKRVLMLESTEVGN